MTVVGIALNMYETRENKTKKIALWPTNYCKYIYNFFPLPKKSATYNTLSLEPYISDKTTYLKFKMSRSLHQPMLCA
jgi:hypothetical protein